MLINSFNLGGAEKLVYDLAQYMRLKDNIRVYICSMKATETELEQAIKKQVEAANISCISIEKKYKGNRIQTILKIRKLIKEYKIDVLHTHGQSPDFYGRLATIATKTNTVVTIHNTLGYSRLIETIQSGLTNQYTAVSNEARMYCKEALKIKREVHVIENGIDFNRYVSESKETKEFNILSVGRIDEQKGYLEALEYVIPFLKKHPDVQWNIVGAYDSKSEYFREFLAAIDRTDVKAQIKVSGTTLHPEDEYKKATCFLLNSKYEGFGLAYIEAMAAELPILGNYVGVIQDVFELGGEIGVISSINVSEYLERIYNDGDCQENIIKRNKEIVEQVYSLKACVDKYVQIYERLVGE